MKISLLGPTYPYRGGIAHYTTLLCRELRKEHEVQFLSFSRQYPKWLFPGRTDRDPSKNALLVEGVDYCLDSMNPLTWITTAGKITRFQPDLLILPWWVVFWLPQFMAIILLVKKRTVAEVVFICHNAIEHESSWWKLKATKGILSRGDRILTHSKEESHSLRDILGCAAKITTAFLPSYAPLCGAFPRPDQAKEELGLKGNVLLFFGFVRGYKGLDILMRAMPGVRKQVDVTLLVVGEFWKGKDNYMRLIGDLGISDFVHVIDAYIPNEEIGLYFSAADLVVQPYRSASGSAICQLAYAFGKPVIATNVGSLREVVIDGENGRIVPPDNVTALADAICTSLEPEVLKRLTDEAKLTAEKFSWHRLMRFITNQ